MDDLGESLARPTLAACVACHDHPAVNKRHSLCRACYAAVWRRVKRGEPWEDALEDRRRQAERGRKGLVSGQGKRAAATLLLLCLCLPLWARESDSAFKWASIAFGAAVFADAWTSERAFDAGYGEKNPALPEHPTDSRFFAQVVIVDGAVYLYAHHLRHKHPALARWVIITGFLLHGAAAARNDRIWDRYDH